MRVGEGSETIAGSGELGGGEGVGAPAGGATDAAGGGTSVQGEAVGSSGGAASGSAEGATGTANQADAAGVSPGASGRGYDAKNVYIGITTINDFAQAANSAGVKGADPGNLEADAKAVIAEINDAGGLFGRKVVPYFRDSRYADYSTNTAAEAQRVCASFTQDRPVAAVVNANQNFDNPDNLFYTCLAKAGVPAATFGLQPFDAAAQQPWAPFFYATSVPEWGRFLPTFLSRLEAQHYFDRWDTTLGKPGAAPVKVGLLYADLKFNARVFGALRAEIERRGYPVETFTYSASSIAGAISSATSATLRFASDQVTHVLTDYSIMSFFATAAEQQRYRPRYGVQSINVLNQLASNAPAAQLNGAVGVGWLPTEDVDQRPSMGDPEMSCLARVKAAGQDYSGDPYKIYFALGICDAVRLLVRTLAAGNGVDGASISRGFANVGPGFRSATTFASGFGAGRPNGVGGVQDVGFNGQCGCFRYLSPTVYRF